MPQSEKIRKDIYIVLGASLVFIVAVSFVFFFFRNHSNEYNQAIQAKKIFLEEIVANDIVIRTAQLSNSAHANLAPREIEALDIAWQQGTGDGSYMHVRGKEDVENVLKSFQNQHSGVFVEIFITDMYGLNIAETNRTSDYYQADESWWRRTYAGGHGEEFVGEIEYDASARVWVVPIYLPVYAETGTVVGVLKALIDTSRLR
jgi:hypothetical protein